MQAKCAIFHFDSFQHTPNDILQPFSVALLASAIAIKTFLIYLIKIKFLNSEETFFDSKIYAISSVDCWHKLLTIVKSFVVFGSNNPWTRSEWLEGIISIVRHVPREGKFIALFVKLCQINCQLYSAAKANAEKTYINCIASICSRKHTKPHHVNRKNSKTLLKHIKDFQSNFFLSLVFNQIIKYLSSCWFQLFPLSFFVASKLICIYCWPFKSFFFLLAHARSRKLEHIGFLQLSSWQCVWGSFGNFAKPKAVF